DGGPGRHGHLRPAPAAGSRMTIKGRTVGFLGAGNLGEGRRKGLLAAKLVPAQAIFATDVRPERLKELDRQYGIQVSSDNAELVKRADIVILAVKPQIMDAVATEIAPAVTRGKLLISIAAGVATDKIRGRLPRDARLTRVPRAPRLVRVIPTTPPPVLEGATAIAKADGLEPGDLDVAREIFGAVGRVVVLGEEMIDAGSGLSGPRA